MQQLLTRMNAQAERWEKQGDPRAFFQRCYETMSKNMTQAIAERRFGNPAWIEHLMHRFAEYYYDALALYDQNHCDTPPVWKHVHDTSKGKRLHVMQHILLGINAHINYDLPLALYDTLRADWDNLDETQRKSRRADHDLVNRIIAETIDEVQDNIIEPHSWAVAIVDRLMGRIDEWLLAQLISGWRTDVWHIAVQLLHAQSAQERENIRKEQETRVLRRSRELASEDFT